MLTIKEVTKPEQMASYYAEDNYYLRDEGFEQSRWLGQGAKALGLSGAVDPQDFLALLQGRVGDTQLGRKQGDSFQHRCGWDCTLSAPKSVSILALVYKDTRVLAAHQTAVERAMAFLEQQAAMYRKREQGSEAKKIRSGNLLVAAFTHDTSRGLDPNLHSHCVVLNATHTDEGWRSLTSEQLFRLQKKAGLLYRNELACELEKLEYGINRLPGGLFEVDGFSQTILDGFSKRRLQILAYLKEHNLPYNTKTAQIATLKTREKKLHVDRDMLQQHWATEIHKYPVAAFQQNHHAMPSTHSAFALAKKAIQHLSISEMSFTQQQIIDLIMTYNLGAHSYTSLCDGVTHCIERNILRPADPHPITEQPRYTTERGQRLENEIISAIQKGFHACKPLSKNIDALERQYNDTIFNNEQIKAIVDFAQNADRFFALQGSAGTGKTTIVNEMRKIAIKNGYDVLALAPTHQAARELQNSLGIETKTVDKVLYSRDFSIGENKNKNALWVVDESSFPSANHIRRLLRFAQKHQARILFVGDTQQLESIEAGQAYKLMQDIGIAKAVLRENVRQNDNLDLKAIIHDVIDGDYDKALSTFFNKCHVYQDREEENRIDQLANHWKGLSEQEKANTLIITPANEERDAMNKKIREVLKQDNKLIGEERAAMTFDNRYLSSYEAKHAMAYRIDDVVRFNRAYKESGGRARIDKFEYFSVTAVDKKRNLLHLRSQADGRDLIVNPNRQGGNKKGGIEAFSLSRTDVCAGDTLRWTDNNNQLNLKRNDVLKVLEVHEDKIVCQGEHHDRIELNNDQISQRHFTHHYASTVYSAQGMTCDHVLALASSYRINLINQKSFYVSISRARKNAAIFTDDYSKLKEALKERTGENTRALTNEEVKSRAGQSYSAPTL